MHSNMMHEEHVSAFSSPMKNAQPARWQRKRALQEKQQQQGAGTVRLHLHATSLVHSRILDCVLTTVYYCAG